MEIKNLHGWVIGAIGEGSTLRESKIFKVIFATTLALFLVLVPLGFWLLSGNMNLVDRSTLLILPKITIPIFFIYFFVYFKFKNTNLFKNLKSWQAFTYIMTFLSVCTYSMIVLVPKTTYFASNGHVITNFFANLYLTYIIIAVPGLILRFIALAIENRLN